MTLPLGGMGDPFGSLMSDLGVSNGDFNPDVWLSGGVPVDQPPTPPQPPRVATEEEEFAAKSLEDLNRERPLADVNFA